MVQRQHRHRAERAAAALRSFHRAGGAAGWRSAYKKLPWQDFARLAHQRARVLILFGEAASLIAEAIASPATSCWGCALRRVCRTPWPRPSGSPSQAKVVLLSPGGASYDAYKDFAARGEHFRTLVNEQ